MNGAGGRFFRVSRPGVGIDASPNAGISVGNVLTQGKTGLTFHVGQNLEGNYGPPRIRPSLAGAGYYRGVDAASWYLFAGAEGRAGMVAFECGDPDSFDLEAFQQLVETHLPPYAQPVFVRIQSVLETTATFKLVKTTLRKQAFHLDQVGDDVIFVKKPHASKYVRLDRTFYEALCRGEGGF